MTPSKGTQPNHTRFKVDGYWQSQMKTKYGKKEDDGAQNKWHHGEVSISSERVRVQAVGGDTKWSVRCLKG